MTRKRPLILVTNDDGIFAKGIATLIDVAVEFGDVIVVAPDSPQSGMGHAVTIHDVLRLKEEHLREDVKAYSCTGTPVDCVKMAMYKIFDTPPDLVLSGINHGSNSSINVIYSGTMSAAVEGALEGVPSIGFSLCDFSAEADFTAAKVYAKQVVAKALANEFPKDTCLNVNIPKLPLGEIKGIKICRQARAFWKEAFETRTDPGGKEYYWMTGNFTNTDKGQDTDEWALQNGFVTVVPVQFDLTAHHVIGSLNSWEL